MSHNMSLVAVNYLGGGWRLQLKKTACKIGQTWEDVFDIFTITNLKQTIDAVAYKMRFWCIKNSQLLPWSMKIGSLVFDLTPNNYSIT